MAVTSRITMQTTGSFCPAGRRWNRASVPAMQSCSRRKLQTDTMVRRTRIVASSAAQDEATALEAARVKEVRQEVTRRVIELGASNRPKEAVREFASMARMGAQPDTMAGTALVHACARNGKMDMAQSVFDELFNNVVEPDAVTFTVLVRGYGAEDPPRWGTIANVLTAMTRNHGLPLTSEVYNAMLEVCARTNDIERGIEIIDRMQLEEVDADEFTLGVVSKRKALRSHVRKTFGI